MNLLLHTIDATTRTALRDPLLVTERRTCWPTVALCLVALVVIGLGASL